jgi:hypothetical protein
MLMDILINAPRQIGTKWCVPSLPQHAYHTTCSCNSKHMLGKQLSCTLIWVCLGIRWSRTQLSHSSKSPNARGKQEMRKRERKKLPTLHVSQLRVVCGHRILH